MIRYVLNAQKADGQHRQLLGTTNRINNCRKLSAEKISRIQYYMRCYFKVRSEADKVSLIYRTEPTTKK